MLDIILEYERGKRGGKRLNREELGYILEYDVRCKGKDKYKKVRAWWEEGLLVYAIKFLLLVDGRKVEVTSFEWLRRYYFPFRENTTFRTQVGYLLTEIAYKRGNGLYEIKEEYGGGRVNVRRTPKEKIKRNSSSLKELVYEKIRDEYTGVSGATTLVWESLKYTGASKLAVAKVLSRLVKNGCLERVARGCYVVKGELIDGN